MRWFLAAVVLVAIVWYVGRLRRMRAIRGRPHLVDLAGGLRGMQPLVKSGYGTLTPPSAADEGRPPPSHATASGGAVVAWTAEPAPEGGASHRITLLSSCESWWASGFLLLFVCDRLGLDLGAIRVARTDRGTTHLYVRLSGEAHAALLERTIEDPPESGFAQYRDRLAAELARHPAPPVLDARSLAAQSSAG